MHSSKTRGASRVQGNTVDSEAVRADVLIRRCQSGDRFAWPDLYTLVHNYLRRHVSRHTQRRDWQEEIISDVLLRLVRNLPNYRCEGNFLIYLRRILLTASLDYFKKQKTARKYFYPDSLDTLLQEVESYPALQDWSEGHFGKVLERDYSAAFSTVPVFYRQTLHLHACGHTYPEIAKHLQITQAAVWFRIKRGRAILSEMLQDYSLPV